MQTPLFNIQDGQEIGGVKAVNEINVEDIGNADLIALLHRALAEELVAWYQYFSTKDVLFGRERSALERFFNTAEKDELYDHAEKLKQRLIQLGDNLSIMQNMQELLGATPNSFSPITEPNTENGIITNIIAEKNAISTYNEIIRLAQEKNDAVTCLMAKEILRDEEEHLRALKDFADDLHLEY